MVLSYMKSRRQITRVNGMKSNYCFWCPSGINIESLTIYINGIPDMLDKCVVVLCVDNTLI